ncbi:MAG: DUF2059 domain-containing protein [Oceanicaulis sp.]
MMKWLVMAGAGAMLAVSGSLSAEAHVDEAERLQHAGVITERMQMESAFADMERNIVPMIEPSIRQGFPDTSRAQIIEAMALLERAFDDATPEFMSEMVGLYAALFTLEELQALSAFLDTPEGARFAELQLELTRQGQAVGEAVGGRIVERILPELTAILTAEADE